MRTNTDPAGVGTGVDVGAEVGEPVGSTVGAPIASGLTCGGHGNPKIAVPTGEGVPVGPDARTASVAKGVPIGDKDTDGVGDGDCVGVDDGVAVAVPVCVGDGDGIGVGVVVDVGIAVALSCGGTAVATVRDNATVGVRGTIDVTAVDAVGIALASGAGSTPEASKVTLTAGVEVITTVAVSVSVALIAIEPVTDAVDVIATVEDIATAVSCAMLCAAAASVALDEAINWLAAASVARSEV